MSSTASMRRSQRHRAKSFKSELEDGVQATYKAIKLKSLEKDGRCASNRIYGEDYEDDGEKAVDEVEEELTETDSASEEQHPKRTTKKSARNRVEQVSDGDTGDAGRQEEEEEEGEDGVGEDGVHGRWRHYHSLCSRLPGRERQIQLLLSLLGEPRQLTCPALYVYGNTSTGKTLVLKTILSSLQVPHAFVNCIECYSPKLLYGTILAHLMGDTSGYVRCDSMPSFIRSLQSFADERTAETMYIVLDKAERLREMNATLLPSLLRLSELTHRQVCTILVSELVWEKLAMSAGGLRPYPLHFPQYTRGEVLAIMSLDCPEGEPLSFYRTFVNHVWNVFQYVCRDLGELRYLSSLLYPKYCEPVESGETSRQETRKLWRHIEPYFRGVMSKIHLREISSAQWVKAQVQMDSGETSTSLAQGVPQSKAVLELPYFSKYLLIASYLASYNPSKTDKKFFSKQKQARTRKSKKPRKEKPNHQLLGPKPFPLDRLMAIFYSILEEAVAPSADIYSQISSLVTLQLVSQLHTKDLLDGPKYKVYTMLPV
ncbi:Origin recognition complex subunit 5 [Geodia barretti]|uniref:Origin recognition complex subunit 5 n=1 Tax=Geodia barretti TaxID=519541 RepID=A0AA35R8E2_GEOBA|nr:Origin recognition complex subunit 5 [Geodia barretti]